MLRGLEGLTYNVRFDEPLSNDISHDQVKTGGAVSMLELL